MCVEKLWHDELEFSQQYKMGCYFGNSLDAFAGYIEKFGYLTKVGVENQFRQKTACPDMSTFCPKKSQKINTFGRVVRVKSVFGSPKYFVFFGLLGEKTNYGRHQFKRLLCMPIFSLFSWHNIWFAYE